MLGGDLDSVENKVLGRRLPVAMWRHPGESSIDEVYILNFVSTIRP